MQQTICGRQYIVKAVSKAGKFNDTACSINLNFSCLVVQMFVLKNSIVTKFCHLTLGGPVKYGNYALPYCSMRIFAYVHAPTKWPKDLRGYCTKVYEIFTGPSGVKVSCSLCYPTVVECQCTD